MHKIRSKYWVFHCLVYDIAAFNNLSEGYFTKMTSNQNMSLSKQDIEDYFKTYLNENHTENDYPDGPFELLDLARVKHQIDVWK